MAGKGEFYLGAGVEGSGRGRGLSDVRAWCRAAADLRVANCPKSKEKGGANLPEYSTQHRVKQMTYKRPNIF